MAGGLGEGRVEGTERLKRVKEFAVGAQNVIAMAETRLERKVRPGKRGREPHPRRTN